MLTFYEYRYYAREKARYPCFKLNTYHMRFFFETLSEAELAIQHRARHPDDYYAYVITELPLGIGLQLSLWGQSLSDRVYLPDGTLWGIRDYCNFIPSNCVSDEYDYWGKLNRFYGRAPEEIRFKPGDIVEVFGCPDNHYWSDNEVNLAIVVKCPPTKDEVAKMLEQYVATHEGYNLCDHNLCHVMGHAEDTYQVLSFACEEIDHSTTIATFRPSLPVSPQRAKKLRNLYEQYKKEKNL